MVSAYGAAGSLVVLLMWIYFSSAVLLFGAGCAKAVEEQRLVHEARGQVRARRAAVQLTRRQRQATASALRCASSKASAAATLMASNSHRPQV